MRRDKIAAELQPSEEWKRRRQPAVERRERVYDRDIAGPIEGLGFGSENREMRRYYRVGLGVTVPVSSGLLRALCKEVHRLQMLQRSGIPERRA